MNKMISVIGGREAPRDLLAEAERLGKGLARKGWTVVGGRMEGVMEAVRQADDAKEALRILDSVTD
jgi:predicted Rossmann-fold nucleotide-binding protein